MRSRHNHLRVIQGGVGKELTTPEQHDEESGESDQDAILIAIDKRYPGLIFDEDFAEVWEDELTRSVEVVDRRGELSPVTYSTERSKATDDWMIVAQRLHSTPGKWAVYDRDLQD